MFSMASGQAGRNQDAAVVKFVTGNSSRAQRRSTTPKMQPAEFKGDKMYTKKVTHLIPNQIPKPIEIC
jgi:hypothetical protein